MNWPYGLTHKTVRYLALALGLCGVALCAVLLYLAIAFYTPYASNAHHIRLILPKGAPLPQIAGQLEAQNVISNALVFRLGVKLNGQAQKLQAGEYEIPASSSMYDVMQLLVSGKILLHTITIPEGLTVQQITSLLENNILLSGAFDSVPEEGHWLPETYKVRRGMARADLAKIMEAAMQETLTILWAERIPHPHIATPREAVILASIVEKETGLANERPLVAAVFLNRLSQNMRLQSDPTIIYGLADGKGTLGRPIRRSEIRKVTPYNTYMIEGLPPTAIANPGKASLEAVLRPIKSEYLYFVADGAGGHVFAKTLEAHNENVKKWRKIQP